MKYPKAYTIVIITRKPENNFGEEGIELMQFIHHNHHNHYHNHKFHPLIDHRKYLYIPLYLYNHFPPHYSNYFHHHSNNPYIIILKLLK